MIPLCYTGGGGASPRYVLRVYIKDVGRKMKFKQEEFDKELERIVVRDAKVLLSIPGVYEAVSEEYNNEIHRALEERHECSPLDGDREAEGK